MIPYLDKIKYLTGLIGALASFLLLRFTKVIGPPNPGPEASALLVSVVVVLTWTVAYFYFKPYRSNQAKRHKWNMRFLTLAVVCGLVYLGFWLTRTFEDNNGDLKAKGLFVNATWQKFIDPANQPPDDPNNFRFDAEMPEKEQIRKIMGYEATQKWTENSILAVEMILLFSMLLFALGFTASMGIMISSERPKP